MAARATDAYEAAREKTRRFLHAPCVRDIIFVPGATEGINLVAQSWGRENVREGDEMLVTHLEHHANIVPWQQLCAEKRAHQSLRAANLLPKIDGRSASFAPRSSFRNGSGAVMPSTMTSGRDAISRGDLGGPADAGGHAADTPKRGID